MEVRRLPPTINEVVDNHSKWLMKKLFAAKERNGDVVFLIKGLGEEVDIPAPAHAAAARPGNAEMQENGMQVKCHRHVLVSQSAYFRGLLEFNTMSQGEAGQITLSVHDYTAEVFEAMVRFLYLGETTINSNDLVDLLRLCQEYLLPEMKQAIEHVFADQLTVDLFLDIYMLAKAFDCQFLKQRVVIFGASNKAALRQKGLLT